MDTILLPNQLDINEIKFGAVKTNPSGGKSIYVSHKGNPIIMQIPEMRCPFGLSKWDKTEKGIDGTEKDSFKYDLLLGFDGMDGRDSLKSFFSKIDGFDKKLMEQGMENSMNWLGKKISKIEVIEELYTPMVRHSRDKQTGEITDKYPPTFKVTVPYRDGKFQCEVYGADNKEVDLSTINLQGSRATCIMQCTGVWVVGKKFGCSWKLLQAKVSPRSNIPKCAFREVEGDKAAESDEEVEHVVPAAAGAEVEDSSDDDELEAKSGRK